jgi:putative transposase
LTTSTAKVLEVARANPTEGTRMVAALTASESGAPVNRKRVQRLMREHGLMREHRLLQPKRSEVRWRRPGYFEVTCPDELWYMDMTSIWVAEHGWCYLNAAIDCCTREIYAPGAWTSAAAPTRRSPSSIRLSPTARSSPAR